MKYIFKKLWPLILLLFISAASVISGLSGMFVWDFLHSFFFFALYVMAAGIAAHFIGNAIPRRFKVDKGFFSPQKWEDGGRFYDRVLRVSKWKDIRFDASKAFRDTRSKNAGMSRDPGEYAVIIQETCAAETTHWLLILLSPLMLLFVRRIGRFFLLLCYIAANLGDIVIQRYNRPRFIKLYSNLIRRQSRT